jgi:hypothetical protein
MLDFSRYPLSQSTLLDNCGTIYLVNSKDLIDSGTFVKAKIDNCIEAGITSLPITGYSTRTIKNVVNGPSGPYTKDLILYNITVVKGFYINIVSEACLVEKKAWYYGYDLTVRLGDCKENIVLMQLEYRFNLVFLKYKPLSIYSNILFKIPTSTGGILMFLILERLIRARYKR